MKSLRFRWLWLAAGFLGLFSALAAFVSLGTFLDLRLPDPKRWNVLSMESLWGCWGICNRATGSVG